MNDAEDQISPAAIARCDLCRVKNFAIGGRTTEGAWHPIYPGEDPQRPIIPILGRRQWCGRNGAEHLLKVTRIVCEPVVVDGLAMNLCQRCASRVASAQREADEAAA